MRILLPSTFPHCGFSPTAPPFVPLLKRLSLLLSSLFPRAGDDLIAIHNELLWSRRSGFAVERSAHSDWNSSDGYECRGHPSSSSSPASPNCGACRASASEDVGLKDRSSSIEDEDEVERERAREVKAEWGRKRGSRRKSEAHEKVKTTLNIRRWSPLLFFQLSGACKFEFHLFNCIFKRSTDCRAFE